MGKDSKPRLHVEIGIDGTNKSIIKISGEPKELLVAACYILNMFARLFESHGEGEFFKRNLRKLVNAEDSVSFETGGQAHGKG